MDFVMLIYIYNKDYESVSMTNLDLLYCDDYDDAHKKAEKISKTLKETIVKDGDEYYYKIVDYDTFRLKYCHDKEA